MTLSPSPLAGVAVMVRCVTLLLLVVVMGLVAVLDAQGIATLSIQPSPATIASVSSNDTSHPPPTPPAEGRLCSLDGLQGVNMSDIPDGIRNGNLVLVDVRRPQELLDTGKIPGSHNVQLSEVATAFALTPELFEAQYGFAKPSAEQLVFTCRSGRRATDAWLQTRHLGYCHARVYFGSFLEWSASGQPIEAVIAI